MKAAELRDHILDMINASKQKLEDNATGRRASVHTAVVTLNNLATDIQAFDLEAE